MPVTPVTFVVEDQVLPIGNSLEGVLVRVYSQDGVTFITEAETDEDGELTLDLEDQTTYWVRFFKVGYAFASRLLIVVDSGAVSNTFAVEGRDLVLYPPSAVPELCRISGEVLGVAGAPMPGVTFRFVATDLPRVIGNRMIGGSKVTVSSDSNGYMEVELVRGGAYDVFVTGYDDESIRIKVPDLPAVSITEVLFPYVARLDFTPPGPLALNVAETATIQATVTLSSGVQTPFELDGDELVVMGKFLTLTSSDTSIASFLVSAETDEVIICAEGVGTATLTASLREHTYVRRLPEPTSVLSSVTIVVS